MTTLIAGGASQVGTALARLLVAADRKVVIASRSGRVPADLSSSPLVTVVTGFDWTVPSSYEPAFAADPSVEYVFMVAPPAFWTPLPVMKDFINFAKEKPTVKRFVYVSAAGLEKGPESEMLATVHTYLDTIGADYVVLRPTWFSDNFVTFFGESIKRLNYFDTLVKEAKVPFVAVSDIAQVGFDAIVNRDALKSNEPTIIGPELLTYDQAAEILSEVLGRPIAHKYITPLEQIAKLKSYGLPDEVAEGLTAVEGLVALGSEEQHASNPTVVFGKVGLKQFFEEHTEAFTPDTEA